MASSSIDERFQAAVNVIKGLPKNGPYQPSTAMMLKFYGLYKQATEGACHQKKPAFWDVVGRAKWDAWNCNSQLNQEQAMQQYVESLREIIETMSFTENVQNFVGSISGLDNINLDELEMVAPGMRELAESHPDSPFNSRTHSPQHGVSVNNNNNNVEKNELTNGHYHINGDSGFEEEESAVNNYIEGSEQSAMFNAPVVDQSDDEYADPMDVQHEMHVTLTQQMETLKQIQNAIRSMNADIAALDKSIHEVRTQVQKISNRQSTAKLRGTRHVPKWWPFDDITPAWFVLLVLWPFIVRRVASLLAAHPKRK